MPPERLFVPEYVFQPYHERVLVLECRTVLLAVVELSVKFGGDEFGYPYLERVLPPDRGIVRFGVGEKEIEVGAVA